MEWAGAWYQVSFTAGIGPKGDARGNVNMRSSRPQFTYKGEVDCYHQVGNRATFSGEITRGGDPEMPFFIVWVEDNGEPGADAATPDILEAGVLSQSFDCTRQGTKWRTPIARGNLQVH